MNTFKTQKTCSTKIDFDIEGDIVKSVSFTNGCAGNGAGVAKLVEGMQIDDVISKLEGVKCGTRQTSCPDQLAKALKEYKEQ